MTNVQVTRYSPPYPPMTPEANHEVCCGAHAELWTCTRNRGHHGDHEAGNVGGRAKVASWPRQELP